MKKIVLFLTLIIGAILVLGGCNSNKKADTQKENKGEIVISAAASLNGVLEEAKKEYVKKHPGVTLHINYGGSGKLAQQIIQGAPVDLFMSAAEDPFNQVKDKDLLENEKKLLSNSLVLIALKGNDDKLSVFQDLSSSKIKKIAIGTPEFVPAGAYAKQTLEYLNIWKKIEPKLIYTQDVSQVLRYVETGNTEAGIVYKTDALSSDKVKIVAEANSDWHKPIFYFAGVLKDGKNNKDTHSFMKFLSSNDARKIFVKYGFTAL